MLVVYVRKITPILLVAMFIAVGLTVFKVTHQDEKQNLDGELWVKRAPNVTDIELFDDEDGGTTTPTTELTPNDEMTIRITVEFYDPTEIYSVVVILYHDSVTRDSPDDPALHATIIWSKTTGTWTLSPSPSTWQLDTDNSSVPLGTLVGTQYIYVVFTPGKVARYSNVGNWVIYAKVTDADNPSALYGEREEPGYNCKYYLEMTVDSTNFGFGSVPPGCTNISFNYTGGINITVISNYWWRLTLNATGWYNNTGYLTVNFSEFDSLLADDDPNAVEATDSGILAPMWVRPVGSYWDHLDPTPDSGTLIHLYLFVTLPSDIPYGHYTTTMSIITSQSAPPP